MTQPTHIQHVRENGVRTYEGPHGWTIADDGGWVPGIYDSEATALAALDVAYGPAGAAFAEMQKRVNHHAIENRAITQADLDEL